MDEVDVRILKILINNGRQTVSEISSQVNLSIPAVSERIRKLEKSGIIDKYIAVLNPKKLKKDITAVMFVGIERVKPVTEFLNLVNNTDDILECHYIAGDYDYLLKITTENTSTLEKILNSIKSVKGVQKTKTVFVLSTTKDNKSVNP
ncbi:MAG TPA: Lrp/AsnC family transcriptional regulator [Clostridiaceae bacterium]|nr:Lrp/AsnC family transcriptional regulator [Clostridiaceae bacterium]